MMISQYFICGYAYEIDRFEFLHEYQAILDDFVGKSSSWKILCQGINLLIVLPVSKFAAFEVCLGSK